MFGEIEILLYSSGALTQPKSLFFTTSVMATILSVIPSQRSAKPQTASCRKIHHVVIISSAPRHAPVAAQDLREEIIII